MSEIGELVAQVAEQLEATVTENEDETWTLDVPLSGILRALVTVYVDDVDVGPAGGRQVFVARAATEGEEQPDPVRVLAEASDTWYARVYVEEEPATAVAEAALPWEGLALADAAHAVYEVAHLVAGWYEGKL